MNVNIWRQKENRTYRKRKERLEGNSSEYEDREAFQCLMLMKLWFDNWMGSSLVSLMEFPPHLFPRLKANLSFVMADGKWNIPRIILDFPLVAAQIMLVTLPVSPLSDKCIWIHSLDGELSAKLAFQFLNLSSPKLEWASVIWRPRIPPSHSFIFWRFMLSKLPTDENLQSRGCTLVSMCLLCSKHAESSTHLFLECTFSHSIWQWLDIKLQQTISLASPTSLLPCVPQRCSSQLRDVLAAAIVHTVHTIWLARKVVRFNAAHISLHATLAKISSLIAMSGGISKGYCLFSDVVILENLFVSPLHRRVRDIIPVVWKAPSVRNLMFACGGLFRDSHGTFLGGFASNIGSVSIFKAEILGLIMVIEYAASNS